VRVRLMDTLYISKDAKIQSDSRTLLVKTADGGRARFPIETLKHVVITGEAGLTSDVIALCARNDVRVTVLDWFGNAVGPLSSPSSGAVHLAQARHALDPDLRLALAKTIVVNAIANLRANLRYRAYRGASELKTAIEKLKELEEKAHPANSVESLMGYEGNARAWYYEAWKIVDPRLDFGARVRRPPNNPLNCLISWFNGLIYSSMKHQIATTHLDQTISFLHSPEEQRSSLALDLAEAFKPHVVDGLIFQIVLRDELDPAWFHENEGVCRLSETGRRHTLEKWIARTEADKDDEYSFKDLFRRQALSLERHVLGIEKFEPFVRKV
jgi:CRISPR-associated protein Cas1